MMKNKQYILILFSFFLLISCHKNKGEKVIVEKNCTGQYVQIDDDFYRVCNEELLCDIEDGTEIQVTIQYIDECKSLDDDVVCYMYFKNEGWVEISWLE